MEAEKAEGNLNRLKGSVEKDLSIETLRGFAIVFMVAGHIIGSSLTGMRVADNSVWRYFYFAFEFIRMPLFTVISGYIYSFRPAADSKYSDFIRGKARRVLLPLIFVATLHCISQYFVPDTNVKLPLSDIWKIYIFPYEHFWFLQAIFLIFLVVGLIDKLKLMQKIENWLIIFLAASLIRNMIPEFRINVFSADRFLNLLPFFILGCGIQRFNGYFTSRVLIRLAIIVFILSFGLQQYTWFSNYTLDLYETKTLSLFVACAGIILLFHVRKNINIMSKIGYYAFGIYLFHVLGTAGSRIFLMRVGVLEHYILFICGLLCGIALPILIEMVFEKSKILRRLFLGLR
jgi:fucose 4-O-acetylase-like acetyltransferase